MATRLPTVNGGPSGVGLHTTNSTNDKNNSSNEHLISHALPPESNSSFESEEQLPLAHSSSKNKKRRKQSRPSRIPLSESTNPLNLSKQSPPAPSIASFFPSLPDLLLSGGSSGHSSSRELGLSTHLQSNRIFNQEAYCDLCHKEFCNKYFLKTHKANKHGVYSDLSPQNGSEGEHVLRGPEEQLPSKNKFRRIRGDENGGESEDQDSSGFDPSLVCNFCSLDFSNDSELRAHMNEKHGILVPPFLLPPPTSLLFENFHKNSSPSEPFDCSRCSSSFSTLYLLRMHKTYFHPPSPPNNYTKEESIKEECCSDEKAETTSDSDELRRLQSMILDLNPSEMSWSRGVTTSPQQQAVCPICSKEFYSSFFLAQHMEQSHMSSSKSEESPKSTSEHFIIPTPGSNILKGERRPSPSLSRSYCTICHKELCNKYFMRTHMQKMHGISIESSQGIGGVTCDICNKDLCSKYFLKVHKLNTHGISDGSSPPPGTSGGLEEMYFHQQLEQEAERDSVPLDLHSPSEPCSLCARRFKSLRWLKTHLITDHGQEGKELWKSMRNSGDAPTSLARTTKSRSKSSKRCGDNSEEEFGGSSNRQMILDPLSLLFGKGEGENGGSSSQKVYRCNFCPFSTSLLVYLYAHERTHSGVVGDQEQLPYFQCPVCFKRIGRIEEFQQHILTHPMLPPIPTSLPSQNNNSNGERERVGNGGGMKKRLIYRCSACKISFSEKDKCLSHVKKKHRFGIRKHLRKKKETRFRCRKCSFTCGIYAKLRLHNKIHHERPAKMFEVVGGGSGVVLQRFLLGVRDEEDPFVPSLLYLPVRVKLSESRQVCFSLTPRS